MQKRQLIEGLTAELYGLIGTISVYKRKESRCFEREHAQIRMLREEAFEMSESDIRRKFQNLRVKFQIKHMLGMRTLRCQFRLKDGQVKLTEFHTGDPIILTYPMVLDDEFDGIGYVRMKGQVVNILGDSTIIMTPENMARPDGNVC